MIDTKKEGARESKKLTSISGSWRPTWECTRYINVSNFGLSAFAAGPPSTPYSLNLYEYGTEYIINKKWQYSPKK